MRVQRWTRFAAMAALIGVSVAACDETSTDPIEDFDAQATAEAMDSMLAAVQTDDLEDAYASLESASFLLSRGLSYVLGSENPITLDVAELNSGDELAAADFIPSEYYGSTLEWDEGQQSYVMSDAAGAPSDGVRVIYYAIDPVTEMPASPLNALGYVDLRDLSTAESDRLGVTIVQTSSGSDVTLADYFFDLAFTFTQSSFDLSVSSEGFLSNGTDQLNFDVSQLLSATETLATITQSFSMDLEGTGNAITFDATVEADPQSESEDPDVMDATATISNGTDTAHLEIMWANNALEGTVFHNDVAVVLISGDLDNPVFTDTDGNELTQQQLTALESLWNDLGDMFEFVEELFGFAAS